MRLVSSPFTGIPLAFAVGAFAGSLDLRSVSVIPCAAVLMIAGLVFTFVWPRFAFVWVLILGGSIFVAHVIGRAYGVVTPYPAQPIGWDFFLPFVPAGVGAGIGLLGAVLRGRFHDSATHTVSSPMSV